MEIGDLIEHDGAPHIVLTIKDTIPPQNIRLLTAVLKNTQTLKNHTIEVRWVRK